MELIDGKPKSEDAADAKDTHRAERPAESEERASGKTDSTAISIRDLERDLINWVQANRVESTDSTYAPYRKQFRMFCEARGLVHWPSTPAVVGSFLRHLFEDRGLTKSTIGVASAAISSEYKLTGVPTPTKSELVKAVKSAVARKAKAEKPKEPLTYEHLVKIAADEKAGSFVDIRDTFMVVLLMAGMLRESEEMNLQMDGEDEDVWVDEVTENGVKQEALFVFVERAKRTREKGSHHRDQHRRKFERVSGRSVQALECDSGKAK